jgi:molybdopterin molybdotransferase
LLAPDAAPVPGRIRDSNSTLIAALLAASSASLVAHARAGETYAEHTAAFATLLAAEPDVILVSGGSSGGEHDHAARLFGDHGFSLVVNQVASRPGKPLLIATRGAQVAIGLPGNPLSHFVCYHLFVARLLARLTGAAPASPLEGEPAGSLGRCSAVRASPGVQRPALAPATARRAAAIRPAPAA